MTPSCLIRLEATVSRLEVTINQIPRFDWKWFISVSLPVIVPILIAGVIGYFNIKTDLGVVQSNIRNMETNIIEIKTVLRKVATDVTQLQINYEKLSGKIDFINQRLSGKIDLINQRLSGKIDLINQRLGIIETR